MKKLFVLAQKPTTDHLSPKARQTHRSKRDWSTANGQRFYSGHHVTTSAEVVRERTGGDRRRRGRGGGYV